MATSRKTRSSSRSRSARQAGKRRPATAGAGRKASGKARSGKRSRTPALDAEKSTSRVRSSERPVKRPPARKKPARTGTTPGGSRGSVLPATELSNTDVSVVPPPPGELPQGGAIADTDGLVRDVTGQPAENVLPLESLEPGEEKEPFDPPADSNAGSPGADVENPADDSYTKPE